MAERYANKDKRFIVHPDMIEAFTGYDGTKDSFKRVFSKRDKQVADGEVFWNADHDEELAQTAKENTDNAIARGWRFPKRKKRGKTSIG